MQILWTILWRYHFLLFHLLLLTLRRILPLRQLHVNFRINDLTSHHSLRWLRIAHGTRMTHSATFAALASLALIFAVTVLTAVKASFSIVGKRHDVGLLLSFLCRESCVVLADLWFCCLCDSVRFIWLLLVLWEIVEQNDLSIELDVISSPSQLQSMVLTQYWLLGFVAGVVVLFVERDDEFEGNLVN